MRQLHPDTVDALKHFFDWYERKFKWLNNWKSDKELAKPCLAFKTSVDFFYIVQYLLRHTSDYAYAERLHQEEIKSDIVYLLESIESTKSDPNNQFLYVSDTDTIYYFPCIQLPED